MKITVKKHTDIDLMQWACSMTIDSISEMPLDRIYRNEHSPMRCIMFSVEMLGIPTFVSTHFRTHSQGITHFVKSLREDRCGNGKEDRWTLTNHGMFLNAQSLINLARKRLCYKSHDGTVRVMRAIRREVEEVDPDLAEYMVRECEYRNGCHEDISCGFWERNERIAQFG